MPCGCQQTCGCTIVGDGVTTSAVTVGDTTTVSAIQTFLGIADTNSIDMILAAGIVSANLRYLSSNSIDLTVGVSGLKADLKLDPASTAPVSITAAGLRVDCCVAAVLGVNTSAGLVIQGGGLVAIKLQDNPASRPAVCENRLRFVTGTGELTFIPDGLTMLSVIDGNQVSLPSTAGVDSGNSLSTSFTNTRSCPVYAVFESNIGVTLTALVLNPGAAGRVAEYQARAVSGGATTGTVVSGIGSWNMTDMNSVQLSALTVLTRMSATVRIAFLLQPGEVAQAQCLVRCLENLVGYQSTLANGSFAQATQNRWYIHGQRQT